MTRRRRLCRQRERLQAAGVAELTSLCSFPSTQKTANWLAQRAAGVVATFLHTVASHSAGRPQALPAGGAGATAGEEPVPAAPQHHWFQHGLCAPSADTSVM